MFERFTDEARRTVVDARDEARQLRAEQVEPVHLLLALSRDPGRAGTALRATGAGPAPLRSALARTSGDLDAGALASVGIDLTSVRAAAEAAFGPGALDRRAGARSGQLRFAEGSKQSLARAVRVAVRRGENRIVSDHLLLGVLAVGDPTVARVLREVGDPADELRERLDGTEHG